MLGYVSNICTYFIISILNLNISCQHIYNDCGLGISEHYEETKEPAARDPRLQPRPYKMYQQQAVCVVSPK